MNYILNSASTVLEASLATLVSLFFLVDPIAAVPAFLVMTAGAEPSRRRRMAKRAAWTCFLALSGLALTGTLIFRLFGITLPAFKIAGGIILLLVGLSMLQGQWSQTKGTESETEESAQKEDVGIIPLGLPMLAGPGSISTVIVFMSQAQNWWQTIPVFVAIGITAALSYWILSGADRVRRSLGETGIRVLSRLMGLLLTVIAVQFMLNGLTDSGILRPK